MNSSESSATDIPEWVIHQGITSLANGNYYYVWHTTCPPVREGHKYAIVGRDNPPINKCFHCKKPAPNHIIMQLTLLDKKE